MKKVNIQPSVSVYGQFKFRTYKTSKALAEYIDNSTQSYLNNKNKLDKLTIKIDWDDHKITIWDNAFGMNLEEFKDALKLGEIPKDNSGRNQFGMGLKTASCWFSDLWSLESTTQGSKVCYKTTFDLKKIMSSKTHELDIQEAPHNTNDSFTKVTLKNLSRKINGKAASKLKKILASTYKSDLESGDIEIILNGEKLIYIQPEIWEDDKYTKYDNSIMFEFDVKHEGKKYPIHGLAAIAATGTTDEHSLGFDLTKNERVITPNVKPEILVGKTNSFAYQRLFGVINIDKLNVTQDKSDFTWDSGLKEKIFENVLEKIKEIKSRANKLRKRDKKSKFVKKEEVEILNEQIKDEIIEINKNDVELGKVESKTEIKGKVSLDNIKFSADGVIYNCKVHLDENTKTFIGYSKITTSKLGKNIKISIDTKHKFLSPILNDEQKLINMVKLIVAKTMSEIIVEKTNIHENDTKKYIKYTKAYFEKILEQI